MRLGAMLFLGVTPLALAGGCLLPSFENVAEPTDAEGGSEGVGGGDAPSEAGREASAGAPIGGQGSSGGPEPAPLSDSYVLVQGDMLTIPARDGVLANDAPDGLTVTGVDATDPSRPEAFDAELTIEADGSISFTPIADFFGRYLATYTVENAEGQSATASVTFIVQPTQAGLDAVAEGVGGVLLIGSTGEALGTTLTALGDVNDDTFDDFAIGAPGMAGDPGAVYVVFGSASFGGLTLGALPSSSDETRFAVLQGATEAPIGRFIASAGTFDSDQIPDILIGSPTAESATGAANDGALFVTFGGDFEPSLSLPAMPASRGISISGADFSGQRLGSPVAGGGDFNGDQKADLLTGWFETGTTTKSACVIMENPIASQLIADVTRASISETTHQLPLSLAFAGDVNGDGKDDVLASSRQSIALLPGEGTGALPPTLAGVSTDGSVGGYRLTRAAIQATPAPVAAAGDVNGDDKLDLAYCDTVGGEATCVLVFGHLEPGRELSPGDWQVSGFAPMPPLPYLASGSDVNLDGFSDVLVADAGAAYVVFGRDSGHGGVDVSSLGTDGFAIAAAIGGSISAVASIGDVNGDGYADFAVGDASAAANSGRVYVVFGGPYAADQR